jgi:ABC-type Mn2+/Zn2+ transport system ATPase subunit
MSYETKNIRNVALLGHGGTGKTTLTESMLEPGRGGQSLSRSACTCPEQWGQKSCIRE